MIYVVATLTVLPDHREPFLAGARACIAATRAEEGCLAYDLHASVTAPDRYVYVERWASRDHLVAHSKTEHFRTWRKVSGPCLAAPTKIEIITPETVDTL